MSEPQSVSHPYGAPPIPSYAPREADRDVGLGQVPASYVSAPTAPSPQPSAWPQPSPIPLATGPGSVPYIPYTAVPEYYSQPFGVELGDNRAKNWIGIASMVFGALSFGMIAAVLKLSDALADTTPATMAWIVVSILALVFGAMGVRAAGRGEANNKGFAIGGMVVGIVMCGFLFAVVIAVIWGLTQL